jgi:hypothetical protein
MQQPIADRFVEAPRASIPPWTSIAVVALAAVVVGACLRSGDPPPSAEPTPPGDVALAQAVPKGDYELRWEVRPFHQPVSSCFNCHETISREMGRPVREHVTSAHYRASVTCHECHGGDPAAEAEDAAHSLEAGFIGKLERADMLRKCGECHQTAVRLFQSSRHAPETRGVRRVTCIECHGAHDLGAGARTPDFSWRRTCLDCHELPEVVDLPPELNEIVAIEDEIHQRMRRLRFALNNDPYPPRVMEPYREFRQRTSDLIHATLAIGIDEDAAEIEARAAKLKAALDGVDVP